VDYFSECKDKYFIHFFKKNFFSPSSELFYHSCVLLIHSKITFSIARNVIMIGLLPTGRHCEAAPCWRFVAGINTGNVTITAPLPVLLALAVGFDEVFD
jgi:hypothetical protein